MPKYTKYLEFSQKERTAIRERDNYRCIFCQIGYEMPPTAVPEMDITDIMHYMTDTLNNTKVSGNYEDMYLQPGNNKIEFYGGNLKVIPNWRCL